MLIIPQSPSADGAYPPLVSYSGLTPPAGYDVWPDSLDAAEFYACNGFVILTVVRGTVSSYQPNTEAWEAWQAAHPPDPEPGPAEDMPTWAALADAIQKGANSV